MANEFKVRKGLIVNGSGSTILDIQGSQGQLFSVTDQLSGSLFSVNDISGVPIMEVFSDNTLKLGQYLNESIVISGSFARVTGSLFGTSSWAINAISASYVPASGVVGLNLSRISTGSITASVDVNPNSVFIIKSASVDFFNISSSSNTTLASNLFIVKNFNTDQPVLTVSQSVVKIATQSFDPTGTTDAGSIWFTSTAMYVGLE